MKKNKIYQYYDFELEEQYPEISWGRNVDEIPPIDPELERHFTEAFQSISINDEKHEIPDEIPQKQLYYHNMGGIGIITCDYWRCSYSEKIVDSIHGSYYHKRGVWEDVGYQCQSCGKFHTLDSHSKNLVCTCGGKLSREEPIFCPKCKRYSMSYKMDFMILKLV